MRSARATFDAEAWLFAVISRSPRNEQGRSIADRCLPWPPHHCLHFGLWALAADSCLMKRSDMGNMDDGEAVAGERPAGVRFSRGPPSGNLLTPYGEMKIGGSI